jgi:streptomycin 6-kinase
VLVHGDIHPWNALQAPGGFKLIDPDGLLAEPAYDLGVVMRTDLAGSTAGDPWHRARRLAELSGLDPTAIWEWSVVERVSTGLACMSIGLPAGRDLLAAADRIALR